MTLTVVIGSSGSGKTTFLEDTYRMAAVTATAAQSSNTNNTVVYLRQYHKIRPYIVVNQIPHFDPAQLPFWDIYIREGTADSIPAGGTLAGEFTAGLSGGQRKLLLFELIYQRLLAAKNTTNANSTVAPRLVILDEPFAGVTEDFVPFVVQRLQVLREHYTVLVVTNDHVSTLSDLSDHTVIVSAVNRNIVQVVRHAHAHSHQEEQEQQEPQGYMEHGDKEVSSSMIDNKKDTVKDRNKVMAAFVHGSTTASSKSTAVATINDSITTISPWNADDLQFFCRVEVTQGPKKALVGVLAFTVVAYGIMIPSFWDTDESQAELVLLAAGFISFFALNSFMLQLPEWRNCCKEEAQALVFRANAVKAVQMNKTCKVMETILLSIFVALVQWGTVNAVVDDDTFAQFKFCAIMYFDNLAYVLPSLAFGLYTNCGLQNVDIAASSYFLFVIFFSTAFSPGAGVEGVKALRFFFPRFYYWCLVPSVQANMESCPADEGTTLPYVVLSTFVTTFLFLTVRIVSRLASGGGGGRATLDNNEDGSMSKDDAVVVQLQTQLVGANNDPHEHASA